jgi:hypothetical protein
MLNDFSRCPIVVAFVVERIEHINTSRKMQRSDGALGAQFEAALVARK